MNRKNILKLCTGLLAAGCLIRLYPAGRAEIRQMKIRRELQHLQEEGTPGAEKQPGGCAGLAGILEYESLHMREEIVQGNDDSYYLDHLCDGTYSEKGTLFFGSTCRKEDMNRVIYGHHVFFERSRMTPLFELLDGPVSEDDLFFTFSDGRSTVQYRMIAVAEVNYGEEGVFDYTAGEYTGSGLEEYNHNLRKDCISSFREEAEEGDRLLTMVTCRDMDSPVRILFIARETEKKISGGDI